MKKLTTEPIAHHTRKGYRQGCRETCCRKAHTELVLYYRNARPLRYRPEMVPVDEARAHVLGLLAQQTEFERLPVTVIADRAGVNRATIVRLISDNPKLAIKTIEADKAARIRRVKFEPVTRNACGTKRRLDALFWQGWSIRRIASKIGVRMRY